ncbi:hypothetical protein [Mesorhizobium sp.]|jgi:hypothetical protein|uniref:hypothetical protein n=1 Tax=Mesorhizobium sp. TaxID=1871066 RepID=UPI000FE9264A|nr:hypothetical protein [Mesorhizobium sp.]RWQ14806.1 MAG: hypothetical protein EOR93_27880 [Mesorhizobium sp.]
MDLSAWHYFLSLERDFERTINFVELASANSIAYSQEYAKLLLLIGSEVDITAKVLCRDVNTSSNAATIVDYQQDICSAFPGMHTIEIAISRYQMAIQPWSSWGDVSPESPGWWKAYNKVKHHRDTDFPKANQGNVVSALCGLLALHLYLHRSTDHLQPYPKLLEYSFPETLVVGGSKALPGINPSA